MKIIYLIWDELIFNCASGSKLKYYRQQLIAIAQEQHQLLAA